MLSAAEHTAELPDSRKCDCQTLFFLNFPPVLEETITKAEIVCDEALERVHKVTSFGLSLIIRPSMSQRNPQSSSKGDDTGGQDCVSSLFLLPSSGQGDVKRELFKSLFCSLFLSSLLTLTLVLQQGEGSVCLIPSEPILRQNENWARDEICLCKSLDRFHIFG